MSCTVGFTWMLADPKEFYKWVFLLEAACSSSHCNQFLQALSANSVKSFTLGYCLHTMLCICYIIKTTIWKNVSIFRTSDQSGSSIMVNHVGESNNNSHHPPSIAPWVKQPLIITLLVRILTMKPLLALSLKHQLKFNWISYAGMRQNTVE